MNEFLDDTKTQRKRLKISHLVKPDKRGGELYIKSEEPEIKRRKREVDNILFSQPANDERQIHHVCLDQNFRLQTPIEWIGNTAASQVPNIHECEYVPIEIDVKLLWIN